MLSLTYQPAGGNCAPPEVLQETPSPGFLGVDARRRELLSAWLGGLNPNTLRAYQADAADFASFSGHQNPAEAAAWLFGLSSGEANHAVLRYRQGLQDRGLSSATVGRRLNALKSLGKVARILGVCSWSLEIAAPKQEKYRDTTGPGTLGWIRMRETISRDRSAQGLRDAALIHLLHDLGLRRSEAAGLRMEDLEIEDGHEHGIEVSRIAAVHVKGKGRDAKERMTLPSPTSRVLQRWLDCRGDAPGAVFRRLDNASDSEDSPLTGEAIRLIVARISKAAGLGKTCRPHGLRHEAITRALDATNGDIRAVARFSRHKKIDVVVTYDDNRRDIAGQIAEMVAGE